MTEIVDPIRPSSIKRGKAPITGVIVLGLMLIYLACVNGILAQSEDYIGNLALIPATAMDITELYRFLTYALMHSRLDHALTNAILFLGFGFLVEACFPRRHYLVFLAGGAICAGLAHVLVYSASDLPLMGASGAIAALLGLLMALRLPGRILPAITYVFGAVTALALIYAALTGNQPLPSLGQTSHVAHMAGLAFGIAWGGIVNRAA